MLSAIARSGFEQPLSLLAQGDASLGEVIGLLLRAPRQQVKSWLDALAEGADAVLREAGRSPEGTGDALVRLARLILDLNARHPGDAGVLVALLLEDRDVAPGEAIYVAPGVPHAYLSGLGVEVMASSDNVLRGGMTSKVVDIEAFLTVLDASVGGGIRVGAISHRITDGPGWRRFLTPSDVFVVDEAEVRGALPVERTGTGPAVLVCLAGAVTVQASDGSEVALERGSAVLLQRGLDPVEVRGSGEVLLARASQSRAAIASVS
jgi:mannose-6-phosphate isomerase